MEPPRVTDREALSDDAQAILEHLQRVGGGIAYDHAGGPGFGTGPGFGNARLDAVRELEAAGLVETRGVMVYLVREERTRRTPHRDTRRSWMGDRA
jgi:hypothetical protein